MVPPPSTPTSTAALASPSRTRAPLRVLLVDDSRSIRALLRVYLSTRGFEFLEAESAEQALVVARAERVDLVITDLNMAPDGLDGVGLVLQLRASADPRLQAVPVLLLTTEADLGAVRRRAAGARITACVNKPISCSALMSLVDAALPGVRPGGPARAGAPLAL